jgi:hypothetical protein
MSRLLTALVYPNSAPKDLASSEPERNLRGPVLAIAAILSPLAVITANGALTLAAVWTLAVLVLLLFRFGEPPVLIFAATLQWIAVTSPLFTANVQREVIGASIGLSTMGTAAWFGLVSLIVLGIGMRIGRGSRHLWALRDLQNAGAQLVPMRLLVLYVASLVFAVAVVPQLSRLAPGLNQQIAKLTTLPVLIAFLILWSATVNKTSRVLGAAVVAVNVAIGFGGYFSSFKEILLLAVLVISMNAKSMRKLLLNPVLVILTGVTLSLLSFWSFIKPDYRAFVNGGTRQQVVLVSTEARVEYLKDQLRDFSMTDFTTGLNIALARVGYITFLARVVETVPERIPHQYGRMWGEAVQHVFMPRAFFPQKKSINDSDRTNEFTGVQVAGAEDGASISIGYVAESYIDFGPIGMLIPILVLGMFWGWGYRMLTQTGRVPLMNVGAATIFVLSGAQYFEASNIKLVGGALTLLPVLYLMLRVADTTIWKLLTGNQTVRSLAAPVIPPRGFHAVPQNR